ncbi:unnamed protein product [Caenorhabditis angaria]|uniref:Uncharacterized protein n=1 Tax=Caenorhabditis angaria TaxID=860376 RepID=A0A9P1N118_9PELO|nr:unnamed protein product [Caenorhabditis angaria]
MQILENEKKSIMSGFHWQAEKQRRTQAVVKHSTNFEKSSFRITVSKLHTCWYIKKFNHDLAPSENISGASTLKKNRAINLLYLDYSTHSINLELEIKYL